MSSEPVVIRGKLKLKGSSSSSSSISGKKRKSSETSSVDQSMANTSSIPSKTINNISQEQSSSSSSGSGYAGNLTEAQRKFMKRKQEVDSKSVKALTATTYRDRVENFNQKLSNMTEHNDIPRISAAGNG